MNLVLIGYRGTGKSSIGHLLAQRLGWNLISTDDEIVKRAGFSIPDIVTQSGWDHFRDLETDVCRDVAARDRIIIDTGGGVILRQQNVDRLKANGVLFWLTAEVPTIARRIGGDTQRPSLTGAKSFTDEIAEVLHARLPKYQAAADHVIATDRLAPDQVADAILAHVRTGSNC
ncbi:MAG: shikimate kinase [Nitrospiraceae bacterium]